MRVKAIQKGFDGVALREVDDEFDMPDGSGGYEGCWFEPAHKHGRAAQDDNAPTDKAKAGKK
jgi:hypothetical protein